MTKQELRDFFTADFGVPRPAPLKKHSFKFYLLCLILFVVPLILVIVIRCIKKSKIKAFEQEVARRKREYPKLYAEHIQKYINSTDIWHKGLDCCNLDESELHEGVKPILIRGQNYDNDAFWVTTSAYGTQTSKQTFSYLFFTQKKGLAVYTLEVDFYNDRATDDYETIFYKHITNIKTKERDIVNPKTKEESHEVCLAIITAGEPYELSVTSMNDDMKKSIRAMNSVIAEIQ